MNWSNVRLILAREIRDQLRDRRTMFMIAVLPLLLYPLLGMSFFQVAQFMREHPTQVLVVGYQAAPDIPALIEGEAFAAELFSDPHRATRIQVSQLSSPELSASSTESDSPSSDRAAADFAAQVAQAKQLVRLGKYEAVVLFPPDFLEKYRLLQQTLQNRTDPQLPNLETSGSPPEGTPLAMPAPVLVFNTAQEKSQITEIRLNEVFRAWREALVARSLENNQLPKSLAKLFEVTRTDIAEKGHRDAAVWSKILPFILLIWALTGAFYPAIDICAGEKERGTLETLLSSPAERSEIVTGKLLTIMLFSMTTSALNMASLGLTGSFVVRQLSSINPEAINLGVPPLLSMFWLLLALIPTSALFSALCLALAAFARSTKEGQYYLMPLLLVTMPLMILPMTPGVEMTLGNSFIPVTGVVLLLRMLLEGNYLQAAPYVLPVVLVTGTCCLFAIRWAIEQFNSESVIFRESERLDVSLWIRQLVVDRGSAPNAAEALLCAVLILVIKFFLSFVMPMPSSFGDFAQLLIVSQVVVIAFPALLMTVVLTSNARKTLQLYLPKPKILLLAALLAVALHPGVKLLQHIVMTLYPVDANLFADFATFINTDNLLVILLLMAVLAPICEEIAFRGFILTGLKRSGHKWRAILISSLLFGFTHAIFQQTLLTSIVGIVLGYLVIQSGSLFAGIVYHGVHNGLSITLALYSKTIFAENPHLAGWLAYPVGSAESPDYAFHLPVLLLSLGAAAGILYWFHRSTSSKASLPPQ